MENIKLKIVKGKLIVNIPIDSIPIDDLCEELINLPMKKRIYIITYILESFSEDSSNSPLINLARNRYKECIKLAKDFKESSTNPILNCPDYKTVSDNYLKEANIWKQFLDIKNKK